MRLMHMPILTIRHNSQPFSHNEPATCGIGSTMSASVRPPIAEGGSVDFFSSLQSPLPVAEHEEYNLVPASILEQVVRNTPYRHKDAA